MHPLRLSQPFNQPYFTLFMVSSTNVANDSIVAKWIIPLPSLPVENDFTLLLVLLFSRHSSIDFILANDLFLFVETYIYVLNSNN